MSPEFVWWLNQLNAHHVIRGINHDFYVFDIMFMNMFVKSLWS